jgi:hypothetical protein
MLPGFAAQGRAHHIHDQRHGQSAIQKKGDDGAQDTALGTQRFNQRHHQGHIKPSNHDQVHYFNLCNLGDIKLTDTEGNRFQIRISGDKS